MRFVLLSGAAAVMLALAGAQPAAAQTDPNESVTVNPYAIDSVPYYPGASNRGALPPVHLHPPTSHQHHKAPKPRSVTRHEAEVKAAPEPAKGTAQSTATGPAENAAAESPPPASEASPTTIPFSLGGEGPATPPPKAAVKRAPKAVASTAPLPKITVQKGLSKQEVVLFDEGSTALSDTTTARLNDLAFSLKTALANGADHVELIAYGGKPGDKSSAARRISLKRALAVREALIDDGVPAGRIDVRALGGVTDNGPTDRVDIFVKG